MPYDVMTKEEANEKKYPLWEGGEYDFTILEELAFGSFIFATGETLSSKKNPMLNLAVKIFAKDGTDKELYIADNVMMTGAMSFKLRHLAEATGLVKEYEGGELTPDKLLFKSGKCVVDSQGETTDPKTGKVYKAKNIIKDYVPREDAVSGLAKPEKKSTKDDLNDDIPF